jgi:hypothetical protein
VISLQLSGQHITSGKTDLNGVPCASLMADKVSCANDVHGKAPVHYAFCEVSEDGPESCPEPVATAHDSNDGEVEVITTRRLFVKSNAHKYPEMANTLVQAIDYSQRGEYTLLYEAADSAGNKAAAMIFHIFNKDTKPPQLSPAPPPGEGEMGELLHLPGTHWSAGTENTGGYDSTGLTRNFKLPSIRAFDAYDGDVAGTVTILVDGVAYDPAVGIDAGLEQQGQRAITATAHDYADCFGKDMQDNESQLTGTLTVGAGTSVVEWGGQVTVFQSPMIATTAPITVGHSGHDLAPPVIHLQQDGTTVTRSSPYGQAVTKEKFVSNLQALGHSEHRINQALSDIVKSEMHLAFVLGEGGSWKGAM